MNLLGPHCPGGACLWFTQGAYIGCKEASGGGAVFPDLPDCKKPELADPTIEFEETNMRTFALEGPFYRFFDFTRHHPWRYPGASPIADPCGIASGWFDQGPFAAVGVDEPPPGGKVGDYGSNSTLFPKLLEQTVWTAGSIVEVAWGITANHGGGYQYRLCPANEPLTEECFQKLPLEFVGDKQWIQYGHGMDVNNRKQINATDIGGDRVVPAGSTWRKNPIPPCRTPFTGGALSWPCGGAAWPSQLEGGEGDAYGWGSGSCESGASMPCTLEEIKQKNFDFGIVDRVKIPDDLPAADYVLSFRWDCEQTPQIWNQCSDVTIKVSGPSTKPFSPTRGCTPCCVEGAFCANCTSCLNNKEGDCAYCWNPLPGYIKGAPKQITCLGHETEDGHAPEWQFGDDPNKGWSPGCSSCWKEGACQATYREFESTVV